MINKDSPQMERTPEEGTGKAKKYSSIGDLPENQPSSPSLEGDWVVVARPGGDESGTSDATTLPSPAELLPLPPALTTAELLLQKKGDLKKQLKTFDITFVQRHGRLPVKAEREPIRHLYQSYNAVKRQLVVLGDESKLLSKESSHRTYLPNQFFTFLGLVPAAAPQHDDDDDNTNQELRTLRDEKAQIHSILRSYESAFVQANGRQVASFDDIRPMAEQYRRYKKLKAAIKALRRNRLE